MNLEEAKANIGKEVVLDESTEPYKGPLKETHDFGLNVYGIIEDVNHDYVKVKLKVGNRINIMPHHLKLKQPNYKIRVTPETSEEVQRLFFELGCSWSSNINQPNYLNDRFLYTENGLISATNDYGMFIDNPAKGITLPELRKLGLDSKNEYGFETEIERHEVEPHNKKAKGFFDNWKTKEITWQDALRAVADGKEVEFKNLQKNNWDNIGELSVFDIVGADCKFRLKPQTTHIEGGDYTKEELLKIAGEME